MQFWKESCMQLDRKGSAELRDVFQFLCAWRDHFRARHGELYAISHLSNPDDPPDAIAHFTNTEISIEVTTIDPAHILQSCSASR